jgi:(4S)-4-hydroxy-5-phosphonooxypentane-2,3-dione isomerase
MHAIIVRTQIKPDYVAAFEQEMRDHIQATRRSEPGCLQFEVCVDKANPRTYHLFEVYADDAAMAAHAKSPTLAALREKLTIWQEDRSYYQATPWAKIGA